MSPPAGRRADGADRHGVPLTRRPSRRTGRGRGRRRRPRDGRKHAVSRRVEGRHRVQRRVPPKRRGARGVDVVGAAAGGRAPSAGVPRETRRSPAEPRGLPGELALAAPPCRARTPVRMGERSCPRPNVPVEVRPSSAAGAASPTPHWGRRRVRLPPRAAGARDGARRAAGTPPPSPPGHEPRWVRKKPARDRNADPESQPSPVGDPPARRTVSAGCRPQAEPPTSRAAGHRVVVVAALADAVAVAAMPLATTQAAAAAASRCCCSPLIRRLCGMSRRTRCGDGTRGWRPRPRWPSSASAHARRAGLAGSLCSVSAKVCRSLREALALGCRPWPPWACPGGS